MPLTVEQFKAVFFDRALRDGVDRGAKKALSKFGAFVWRRDKSSMKYRKKSSPPGGPPSVHRSENFTRAKKNRKTGAETRQPSSPLRELTLFGYDKARRSVVVGAASWPRSASSGEAPHAVEYGGASRFVSTRRADRGALKVARYAARPHLRPAFNAELPQLKGFLKDCIK